MTKFLRRYHDNFADDYGRMYGSYDGSIRCMNVSFIVTHECNLRCSYCYEHNKGGGEMDLDTAKKCVDLLFKMDRENHPYINPQKAHGLILDFIGGEPLLKIDLITETMRYFRDRALELGHRWATQYMVSMTTNGMLYDDPAVQNFLRENKGRATLTVTVDGDKQTHDRCRRTCDGQGSYDRAAAAFRDLQQKFGHSGSKFTIAPANVDTCAAACRHIMEEFDLKVLHCNCVYEEGWTEELAKTLYFQLREFADWLLETERYRECYVSIFNPDHGKPQPETNTQNWCGGTGSMLAFDIDGVCYPCLRYAPLSIGNREPYRIGDVEHGIAVLPEDARRVAFLDSITRQSQSPEQCLRCPIAAGCGWCSAYNYEYTGSPNKRVTFICPTHKARTLATAYYLNNVYRREGSGERYALHVPREWAEPIVGKAEYEMLVKLAGEGEDT